MCNADHGRTVTYAYAREHLADVCDEVARSRRAVRIARRGHEELALIPAAELASLEETVHVLRSPKNAARVLTALARSTKDDALDVELDGLRRALGLDDDAMD